MKASVIHRHGGPDVLSYEDVDRPEPGPGEALVRIRATALNRLDLWARSGPPVKIFPWTEPDFPIISGSDGAGEVAAVGDGGRARGDLPVALLRRVPLLPGR
jgi:NADPH:quinone reductase-like Zn-dependent oxidoreductase